MPITLTVNGKSYDIQAEPETPLLYVLRNELGLNGPKFGCGSEQCGACAVLVGAKARLSCRLPVGEVGRAGITTLEGLASDTELHPVQQAFLKVDAFQCAYCASGVLMSAVSLLEKNPKPTEEEIVRAMQGNICRCGTYPRIIEAINQAASV